MIKSKKQYNEYKEKVAKLEVERISLNEDKELSDVRKRLKLNSIVALKNKFESEISEYDQLNLKPSELPASYLRELGKTLIRIRLSKGVSQSELASRMGVHTQQIQRWEKHNYEKLTIANVYNFINALEVAPMVNCIDVNNEEFILPEDTVNVPEFKQEVLETNQILVLQSPSFR